MPLMPKRVKHRKVQRGSRAGLATRNTQLAQGDYGLKTLDRGWITAIQIEACRVCINRHLKHFMQGEVIVFVRLAEHLANAFLNQVYKYLLPVYDLLVILFAIKVLVLKCIHC